MLLRFRFANHLSIHRMQELSLVTSSLKDRDDSLIDCNAAPSGSLVPAMVLYGPNASGKTNLVDAIQFMRNAVLYSHSRGDAKGGFPRQPFKLDPDAAAEATHCEVDFVLDDIRHHYGFRATDDAIESEWLYCFPSAYKRRLFERDGDQFSFGRSLRGQNTVISGLTRANSLFLSAAVQNGHKYLSRVSAFFDSIRVVRNVDVPGPAAISQINEDEGIDERVIAFLQRAGTGVVGYERREVDVPEVERSITREVFALVVKLTDSKEEIPDPSETKVVFELSHRTSDGKRVTLDLDRESAGTRRLLLILGATFKAVDKGSLLVIDELDASLHTQVCESVLRLFSDKTLNPLGAQLIATTHDTNLMGHSVKRQDRLLRRDQLWFVAKNRDGASEVFPLTDFRTRKDDNLERGYLEGRYGAVPFDIPWGGRGETE